MQKSGFEDSGQVRENVGDMLHPDYIWFGSYYKHIKVEDNVLPDMREKVKEYISELDVEIERCVDEAESILAAIGDYDENPMPTNYIRLEERIKVLGEVKNDLQARLDELI